MNAIKTDAPPGCPIKTGDRKNSELHRGGLRTSVAQNLRVVCIGYKRFSGVCNKCPLQTDYPICS